MIRLQFRNGSVPISMVTLGSVVGLPESGNITSFELKEYGHIIGFDRNCTGEVILRLDVYGENCSMHPGNCWLLSKFHS